MDIDSYGMAGDARVDALTEWLSTPPVTCKLDPIGWWAAMDVAGHPLARMALDFLSAPGQWCLDLSGIVPDFAQLPQLMLSGRSRGAD
jgi:hypothetical protein